MSTTNNTTKLQKKQYHHLTEKDRSKIQSLLEQKDKKGKRLFNNTYIAKYIGVNKSTISRELKRTKSHINEHFGSTKSQWHDFKGNSQFLFLHLSNLIISFF